MDCNWNEPGHAPFRQHGTVHIENALIGYGLPAAARAELLWKIKAAQSDATVFISRDGIDAAFGTASNLRNMHYKKGRCSGPVIRNNWSIEHREPALVYCSKQHCVAVPVICGNISQIDYHIPEQKDSRSGFRDVQPRSVPEPGSSLTLLILILACYLSKTNLKSRIA